MADAPEKNDNKIIPDKKNYRVHSDKNKRIIKKSVDELGAGRSILLDSENIIIAGNGVKEAWGDRPVKIIETDGTELIAVKRTDLKTDDEKRKTLALIDNHASDTSDFDNDLINEDFESEELNEWEFEEDLIFASDDNLLVKSNDRGGFSEDGIKIIIGSFAKFFNSDDLLFEDISNLSNKLIELNDSEKDKFISKLCRLAL